MKLSNTGWRMMLAFLMLLTSFGFAEAQVRTGLDNLVATNFKVLKGKRVGLITNQTGRTRSGAFGPDLFAATHNVKLVALYGPEHGLKGQRAAGVTSDTLERYLGVPVYSLYGSTRKPTKNMLKGVNALVFDIQDAGVRPYTFLSSMILAMEAAAENGIPFYVLDRPDPLSGDRVEGNTLDVSLKSFVGQVPVPYLHGMTFGELATMAKAKGWFHASSKLKLSVIPMTGWKRKMYWPETGLPWVAPSPNVPRPENAVGLAMLGAIGEFGILSVGAGSDAPFLRIGSNIVHTDTLQAIAAWAMPRSIGLTNEDFIATTSAGTKTFHGIRLQLPDQLAAIPSFYEGQFRLVSRLLSDPSFRTSFAELPQSVRSMFQKVTGERDILDEIQDPSRLEGAIAVWHASADAFKQARAPFLLYK